MAAGRPLAASLEETRLFTTMIANMVRVGEESGQLAMVMEQMAPYYKERMETMIASRHQAAGTDHHRRHGNHNRRADALDLHAHVRNGRKDPLAVVMPTTPSTGFRSCRPPPSGFTLMELMVAVAIMGVLIGMSAPYFGRSLEQARADFAVANLRAIWAAERLYWLENHAYTDKLTQTSPKGLVELGLIDPGIVSTTGD